MQVLIHPTVWMHFLGLTKSRIISNMKKVMEMVRMNDKRIEVKDASTGNIDIGGIFGLKW